MNTLCLVARVQHLATVFVSSPLFFFAVTKMERADADQLVRSASYTRSSCGSNFLTISERQRGLSQDPSTRESEKHEVPVITDSAALSQLSHGSLFPFTPVYGSVDHHHAGHAVQIVGTHEGDVWLSFVNDSLVDVERVGRVIDLNDARLAGFEDAVLQGHMLVAFESVAPDGSNQIEAVVQTHHALYAVKRSQKDTFAIQKIGSSSN